MAGGLNKQEVREPRAIAVCSEGVLSFLQVTQYRASKWGRRACNPTLDRTGRLQTAQAGWSRL